MLKENYSKGGQLIKGSAILPTVQFGATLLKAGYGGLPEGCNMIGKQR